MVVLTSRPFPHAGRQLAGAGFEFDATVLMSHATEEAHPSYNYYNRQKSENRFAELHFVHLPCFLHGLFPLQSSVRQTRFEGNGEATVQGSLDAMGYLHLSWETNSRREV